MITSINEKNITEYKELFTEAYELLSKKDKNVEKINDIEGYFQHLKDLINMDGGKKFSMLPLDEDFFIIDANKREIQIPENFKKNGLSVQGDETAEIVWFEIDRYYDIMDFNNTIPFIQWKRKNEDEIHKSAIWYSTIEKKPGKLVFGWPIDYSITEVPGDIEFSVRFLTYDNTNTLTYSFNTLPATININKSLDIKNIDASVDNQILSKIQDRIFNSVPGDLSQPLPPIFIQTDKSGYLDQGLTTKFLDIDSSKDIEINLDKKSDGFSKTINTAVFSTADGVTYNWQYKDSSDTSIDSSNHFSKENPGNTAVYFKIGPDNKISDIDKKLSIYKDDQCTKQIDINEEIVGTSFSIIDPPSPAGSKVLKCWIKGSKDEKDGDFSSCTIKKPGKYYVKASNPNSNGYAGNLVSATSKIITVPYPTKPKLLEYLKIVDENNTSKIQNNKIIIPLSSTEIKIKPNYTIPEEEKNCLSFEWKNDYSNSDSPESTNEILTLTNESELGNYKVVIKNSYNGGLTQNEENLSLLVTRTLSIVDNKSFISYDQINNKLIQTITLDIGTSKTLPLKYYLEGIEFQLYQTGIALSPNLTKESSMTNLTEKEFGNTVNGLNSTEISINRSSGENQASRCIITCSYPLPNLNDNYPSVAGIVRIKRDWNSTETQEFDSDTYSKSELIPKT